jgi:hypothetical protein
MILDPRIVTLEAEVQRLRAALKEIADDPDPAAAVTEGNVRAWRCGCSTGVATILCERRDLIQIARRALDRLPSGD